MNTILTGIAFFIIFIVAAVVVFILGRKVWIEDVRREEEENANKNVPLWTEEDENIYRW